MKRHSQVLIALTVAALFTVSANAQNSDTKSAHDKTADSRPRVVIEIESTWKRAKKWTLDYIDAMPAEAMNYKPKPEVRSFAEQMLHLAFWNHGFGEFISGKASPYGKDQKNLEARQDLQTKAELRKTVEASYDTIIGALGKLDEAQLLEVTKYFNTKATRFTILSAALDHQTHHRGQTTIYLRLKGVTPPPEP
jgi:uncharacterized damage-inducible protein DinB